MTSDQYSIELTADGSHTIRSSKFKATFHSIHGAIRESEHVFINEGLQFCAQNLKVISILEVGFGTGLNAALSYLYAKANNLMLNYTSIDAYPIGPALAAKLNYQDVNPCISTDLLIKLHAGNWDKPVCLANGFVLNRHQQKLQEGVSGSYDLIFFDAFSSKDQAELWTPGIFLNMYEILNHGGVFVTYACTGKLKRVLKACKFKVSKLPGPPGKKEMIRAEKI